MKKFLTMVLFVVLLSGSITSFAQDPIENFNSAWNAKYLSGTLDYSIYTKLNSPLPSFIDPDGDITKALNNANINYNITYQSNESEDVLKAFMLVNFEGLTDDIPDMKIHSWIDMDLSDFDNFKYKIIMKYIEPQSVIDSMGDKYLIIDYSKIPEFNDFLDSIKPGGIFDLSRLKELEKDIFLGLDKEITPDFKDGVYTINWDEKTFKGILQTISINMCDIIANYFVPQFSDSLDSGFPADTEEIEKSIESFFETIADVQLFDPESAVKTEITLDDSGFIKNAKYTINVNTDIFEIAEAFNMSDSFADVEADSFDIDGVLVLDMKYDKTNQPVEIEFPEINAENSINLLDTMNGMVNPYGDGITVIFDGAPISYENEIIIDGENIFFPLRQTLNVLGVKDENILYDNGDINIITLSSVINLSIDNDTVYLNDEAINISPSPMLINDRTYVSDSFLSDILGLYSELTDFGNGNYVINLIY